MIASALASARPDPTEPDVTSPDRLAALRREIAEHGFCLLEAAIPPRPFETMRAEACAAAAKAGRMEQNERDVLAYRARVNSIGPEIAAFYEGPLGLGLVERVFGGRFELTRDLSCITYYGPGDHLGPHRDSPADRCCVTILAYLEVERPAAAGEHTGLELRIYGEEWRPGEAPIHVIPTRTGSIVLGRGARFWHERPILQPGEAVTALTGCYRQSAD